MNDTSLIWLTDLTSVNPLPTGDPLENHRDESWRWALLDNSNAPLGDLDGVNGAHLEFNVNSTIRGGGNLTWTGKGEQPDWLKVRLQPWYVLKLPLGGELTWPLGVFIPAAPGTAYSDGATTVGVELYDKLLVLDQDCIDATYTVATGAVVTTAVRTLIAGTGELLIAIEDSTETLDSPMVWEVGTSKLRIINDLLAAINYFALWCDGFGAYRAEPYKSPQTRPIVRTFTDDENSIYAPDFTHDQDTFNIPNKVIQIARSDGDTAALTATATNTDPDSPFSQPSRGRWIIHADTDVEATSQSVLNAIAARRLNELQQVSSAFEISHALVPLELNDVVRFQQGGAGLDARAVVQTMSIDTTVGALVRTRIREVVE